MKPDKTINKQLVCAGALLFAFCVPDGLFAAEQERRIEEVTVTAERREASIQDTSISITAFTAEYLDDFGIRNQEDLQNFIPATTIQPYDSTIRGVGRNFRALGGDPGVATYMNGIYSEDLLTATAATFWDVERIEVLRGPQGTLYGRNAVGGAINVLYKEPADELDYSLKSIVGNFGTAEVYGMLNTPLIEDVLSARVNFALRDRDGVVEEIGPGEDIDGLGTENIAVLFKWTPSDTVEVNLRQNFMDIDRSFGGANGAGLVVLNEDGNPTRNTENLVPGFRFIDTNNTDPTNFDSNDWYDQSQPILTFTNPLTGALDQAQRVRPGIDPTSGFNGFQNAAASLDGFNYTSPETAAIYNACVFPGDIDGDDICAATNGLNRELFEQEGTQFNISWDVNDRLELKYLYGFNRLSYQRNTDDDNTASMFHDRQFYVNHEAEYSSHEIQAFYDLSDTVSVTSGYFIYDATIDQRGDFHSSVGEARLVNPYQDNTSLSAGAAAAINNPGAAGINASTLAFQGRPMVSLFSAKMACEVAAPAESCARNHGGNNLQTSAWFGDSGNPGLNVINGPRTTASDLLYATQTKRDAFAAYTQAAWDINETFTLTLGIRYAEDKVAAEENLWRYSETGATSFLALYGGLAAVNRINGGLVDDGTGALIEPTPAVTNGGIPFALSVYRPFERTDRETTGRINLDWDITDNAMMYFSATSGYRSGGFNLVFFSNTNTYDPEELIAYEIGYKTRFLDNTLQLNGSFYLYDYETIHTVGTEVTSIGGTTTSVLEAPGAEVWGIEAEVLWLPTNNLTLGGNFSFTASEYNESLLISDPSRTEVPESLYPDFDALTQDIKGNQVLQVPEGKVTTWASYLIPMQGGASVELFGVYSWTDDVYYSPFESQAEKAEAYGRADVRASWTSANNNWTVSAFVNNVFNDVANLQILRQGEAEFFRHNSATTLPRAYGLEFTYAY